MLVVFIYFLCAVSLECVNVCNLWRGDGNGRHDCSYQSCAWKSPRVLTGFLAGMAARPHHYLLNCRNERRNGYGFVSFAVPLAFLAFLVL